MTPTWVSATSTRSAHSTKHARSPAKTPQPSPPHRQYRKRPGSADTRPPPSERRHTTPTGSVRSAHSQTPGSSHSDSPSGSHYAGDLPRRGEHQQNPKPTNTRNP